MAPLLESVAHMEPVDQAMGKGGDTARAMPYLHLKTV